MKWVAHVARACSLAVVVLALTSAAGFAFSTPERTGYVTDQANMLDRSTSNALDGRLRELTSRSGGEVVLVTLSSLQGVSIETWGDAIGEAWGIGGSAHNGILLIVAPNDRKVRIAVGTGVRYRFSDDLAASIVSNRILPRFKSGDMVGGINAGVDGIAEALNLEASSSSSTSSSTSRPSYNVYPAPDYPLGQSTPSVRHISIGSQVGSIVTWALNHIVLIVIIVVIAFFVIQLIRNPGSFATSNSGSGYRSRYNDPWYDDNRWGRSSWGGSWGNSSSSWGSSSSGSSWGGSSHSSSSSGSSSSGGGGGRSFGGGASGSW